MSADNNETTVMFADIVGSTRLYEVLGDKSAEDLISTTLRQLSKIVAEAGGDIVKTIGDELMCRFTAADAAIDAARKMHEFLAGRPALSRDSKLALRIGAHQGPTIENEGDLFGDTVNIASRVASLARAGKTVITGYTHENLSAANREYSRLFTRTTVKGKELPIDVYDVVWEQTDELTRVAGSRESGKVGSALAISYGNETLRLEVGSTAQLVLGRSRDCDLVVSSPNASREHCRIECNRGKFILRDNSANGTYVVHNQTELLFHQESVPLLSEGTISLGAPGERFPEYRIHYLVE